MTKQASYQPNPRQPAVTVTVLKRTPKRVQIQFPDGHTAYVKPDSLTTIAEPETHRRNPGRVREFRPAAITELTVSTITKRGRG